MFIDSIAEQETGSTVDPHIRTKARNRRGSSAYGPLQITQSKIETELRNNSDDFTEEEATALIKLYGEQSIALKVGGRDRKRYEKLYTKKFLDDYDYGGRYRLSDPERALIESASEKMLRRTLGNADGDFAEAAKRWHGGRNHGNDQEHVDYSDSVLKIFNRRMGAQKPGSSVDKVPERSYRSSIR